MIQKEFGIYLKIVGVTNQLKNKNNALKNYTSKKFSNFSKQTKNHFYKLLKTYNNITE